jgi:SAM-dependent MidA family methyltransferase
MRKGNLRSRLIARIRGEGPMRIDAFMDACLHDPAGGYYAVRPGLGEDFITAPLASQMFGELLGAWAGELCAQLGKPVRLIELGPGDGTLMADVLRAFPGPADIVLVETSGPLRARQAQALAGHTLAWVERIEEVTAAAPAIVLGNEFLDCLPIRQETADGERHVAVDRFGTLVFDPPGPVTREWSPALAAMGAAIGALVAKAGGAALMIDYALPGGGDSLQAVRGHQKEHPLANPGLADLTAHVDFAAFLAAAETAGARAWPVLSQNRLLRRLGIEARAAALAKANPDRADVIARQLDRLISAEGMGALFKAACVSSPGLTPPAFA